jgi:hypothetical protein
MSNRPATIVQRYANPYRLASYVLMLYALGHTVGAVVQTPQFGAAAGAVAAAMKSVHFDAQGFDDSWYGFYEGFGWLVSLFFVTSSAITWHIGGKSVENRRELAGITWPLCLSYTISTGIAFKYFFMAPIVFSCLVAFLLGLGCARDSLSRTTRSR